jgi:hypothetical protein
VCRRKRTVKRRPYVFYIHGVWDLTQVFACHLLIEHDLVCTVQHDATGSMGGARIFSGRRGRGRGVPSELTKKLFLTLVFRKENCFLKISLTSGVSVWHIFF